MSVARGGYNSALTELTSAETARSEADRTLSTGNLQRSIQNAQLGVQAALQKQRETLAGPTTSEKDAARSNLESAKAALASAQARYDDLFELPAPDVLLPLQNSIDQAQADVDDIGTGLRRRAAHSVAADDGGGNDARTAADVADGKVNDRSTRTPNEAST